MAGVLLVFLRSVFRHTQSSSESHVANLIGTEANVITPIPENGVGEIAYVVGGYALHGAGARGKRRGRWPTARPVKITRIVGTQFYVTARMI